MAYLPELLPSPVLARLKMFAFLLYPRYWMLSSCENGLNQSDLYDSWFDFVLFRFALGTVCVLLRQWFGVLKGYYWF